MSHWSAANLLSPSKWQYKGYLSANQAQQITVPCGTWTHQEVNHAPWDLRIILTAHAGGFLYK